jgi:NAD(P)-dependent dehydrogenase (short-subunit alcohol dehydrogenase family)
MDMELVGRTALVTGGARGVGRALVEALAAEGAHVYSVDRDAHDAPDGAESVRLDVTDETALSDLIAQTPAPVQVLVNNAAYYRERQGLDFATDEWDAMFAVVARATFVATREVTRRLREAGLPGAIVNISSVAGKFAFAGQADYCAAKAAVLGFTRAAALDVAADGITVNAIVPGTVDTPMISAVIDDLAGHAGISPDEQRARLVAGIPIGRMQLPEEIAAGAVFLASTAARAITGESLTIDGGLTRD